MQDILNRKTWEEGIQYILRGKGADGMRSKT
jgi:hypothetical protein